MKKTIITYTNRKTGKEYIFEGIINEGTTVVLVDTEGNKHLYAASTVKKNYKRTEKEIEVEEPKTEKESMTKHQKDALKKIKAAYNWIVGGYLCSVQDGEIEEMPEIGELFEEVFNELLVTDFEEGKEGGKASICIKFAGKAFIREQLAKLFRADGYEIPEELLKAPVKQQGHSNIIDGERVNLRRDEAEKTVVVRAFTGMLIGTFKVEKETQALITVNTAKGSLIFDKKTGIQVNTEGRFANRIDL